MNDVFFDVFFDGVVDVVGMALTGGITEYGAEQWERQLAACLRHVFLTVQIGGAALAGAGGGSMVVVGSSWGVFRAAERTPTMPISYSDACATRLGTQSASA